MTCKAEIQACEHAPNSSLRDLVASTCHTTITGVSKRAVKLALRLGSQRQHQCHAFLVCLRDALKSRGVGNSRAAAASARRAAATVALNKSMMMMRRFQQAAAAAATFSCCCNTACPHANTILQALWMVRSKQHGSDTILMVSLSQHQQHSHLTTQSAACCTLTSTPLGQYAAPYTLYPAAPSRSTHPTQPSCCRVAPHTHCLCRSWQPLTCPATCRLHIQQQQQ